MHRFPYRLAMLWLAVWVGSFIGVSVSRLEEQMLRTVAAPPRVPNCYIRKPIPPS